MDGVREATFSYREGSGVVTFDTTRTSLDAILQALHENTDYRAIPRDGSGPEARAREEVGAGDEPGARDVEAGQDTRTQRQPQRTPDND